MSDRFDHTLERTLEPKVDEPGSAGLVRRIELITGQGRRRRWSTDDKARIVLESLAPGANVSEVARRHGLSPQQLFGWRREARTQSSIGAEAGAALPASAAPEQVRRTGKETRKATPYARPAAREPVFAPVVVAASLPPQQAPAASAGDMASAGGIEIAIGDTVAGPPKDPAAPVLKPGMPGYVPSQARGVLELDEDGVTVTQARMADRLGHPAPTAARVAATGSAIATSRQPGSPAHFWAWKRPR